MRRRPFNQVYVFRHVAVSDACKEAFHAEASTLIGRTVYRVHPTLEEAPHVTDCLTSIHYLFKKALQIEIELTWIGDMPRELAKRPKEWKILLLDRQDAQFGDILFTKHSKRRKRLSHVGMIFGPNTIFHCSSELKTAQVVEDKEFFASYEQVLSLEEALRYIDPRNIEERTKHRGLFMENGCLEEA